MGGKNAMEDGYKTASIIYDPILERGLKNIRIKTKEVCAPAADSKILEVCCGTGTQAAYYADSDATVVGMDISKHMISKAKLKEKNNLSFIQGDATAIPYEDEHFDCASTGYALHEISEALRLKFLKEMFRVIKPGGSIVVVDFSIPEKSGFLPFIYKMIYFMFERVAGGSHYRNYLEWMKGGGLEGFLERNGITDIAAKSRMSAGNLSIIKIRKSS